MVLFKATFELLKGAKVGVEIDMSDAAQVCENSGELWASAHNKAWDGLKEAMKTDAVAADLIRLEQIAE